MKPTALLLFATFLCTANAAEPISQDQVTPLLKEVQAQQATIASNQQKIETRIAAVVEAVRVARIYSSRGGR